MRNCCKNIYFHLNCFLTYIWIPGCCNVTKKNIQKLVNISWIRKESPLCSPKFNNTFQWNRILHSNWWQWRRIEFWYTLTKIPWKMALFHSDNVFLLCHISLTNMRDLEFHGYLEWILGVLHHALLMNSSTVFWVCSEWDRKSILVTLAKSNMWWYTKH